MNKGIKDNLIEKGVFSELDIHFANLMQSLDQRNDQAVFLAAALVSSYKHKGHVCLDLRELKKTYFSKMEEHVGESFPENEEWIGILRKSSVVGRPGDFKPLILDSSSRLYLNRYYGYQESIAQHIKHVAKRQSPIPDRILFEKRLDRLFPAALKDGSVDLQRIAAIVSAHKQLCVISGGPGTGKTTTVTGIIALLLEQAGREGLNIILAAPTGKSAARLRESVKKAGENHRMLGTTANARFFKYNKNNRLDGDVVIIDEASMIDIALMAKLLEALRDDAKLIMIGDRHQLASVEAGSVFADICGPFDINKFSDKFSGKFKAILNETTGCGVDSGR
ncbi:MAG: AAA family ATPase [Deltaproteobacteria bacterium]|nr:AAA family ATPase [Deltaproteobacteria bacterium]